MHAFSHTHNAHMMNVIKHTLANACMHTTHTHTLTYTNIHNMMALPTKCKDFSDVIHFQIRTITA